MLPIILAIDDNPSDILLLRHGLDVQGEKYRLEILTDGAAALQFISEYRRNQEPEPCVILLDLHLPKHDGIEILKAIRQEPVLAHIHVVVLTSLASPLEQADVGEMGAIYRVKPHTLSEYRRLAAEVFEICRGATPELV